jgi:predicted HTH domain antitoxin
MTYTSLTTALALYRSETLGLEQAAAYGGVATPKLAAELRARGIQIRTEDEDALPGHTAN